MNISRRQLLAAGGAALFTLNESMLGGVNALAASPLLELDHPERGELDANALAAWPQLAGRFDAQDWATGNMMWPGPYACMPYMVDLGDGVIVSTLTVNDGGEEGATTQRTIVLRSTDHGATWAQTGEMEPASAPESSWGMPWLDAVTGRLFVFYTYNVAGLELVPYNDDPGGLPRCDSVGVVAYRSSTDGGLTWSARQQLTLPVSAIDLRNPWAGAHRLLWLSGHSVQHGAAAYLGLSKMGRVYPAGYMFSDTEAFVVKVWEASPGVLASSVSAAIRTEHAVNEEPSVVVFDDGLISVLFRTNIGRLGEAVSDDDGATWSVDWARDRSGSVVSQPRAKAAQTLLPDGRVFQWGHNNNVVPADAWSGPRHPVYYRLGERAGDRIVWGSPRLLLCDQTMTAELSYPSMLVDGGALLVATSDKVAAKVFRFPLAGL